MRRRHLLHGEVSKILGYISLGLQAVAAVAGIIGFVSGSLTIMSLVKGVSTSLIESVSSEESVASSLAESGAIGEGENGATGSGEGENGATEAGEKGIAAVKNTIKEDHTAEIDATSKKNYTITTGKDGTNYIEGEVVRHMDYSLEVAFVGGHFKLVVPVFENTEDAMAAIKLTSTADPGSLAFSPLMVRRIKITTRMVLDSNAVDAVLPPRAIGWIEPVVISP